MNGRYVRLSSVSLALVMIFSLHSAGVAIAATNVTDRADAEETLVVSQGDDCYEAAPLGNGTETVESFYDYGADSTSSEGTTHLQENQVSNLFAYHGSEGYSLVFLHDEYGDAPHAGTVSMNVTGLPADGTWAVEDDSLEDRNDEFDHSGTRSEIDWLWAPNRTDGAVFRGLTTEANATVTVDPAFNERAAEWGDWEWSGDEDNQIESWRLLGENGTAVTTLAMTENVTVSTGECGGPFEGIVAEYNTDGDDEIDLGEFLNASTDFAKGEISHGELLKVTKAYVRT